MVTTSRRTPLIAPLLLAASLGGPLAARAATLTASANGSFVTADLDNAATLTASRTVASTWEQFDVVNNADGTISLRAQANGLWVAADLNADDRLVANRTVASTWEKFRIVAQSNGTVALVALANNMYVSADLNLGGVLVANRTAVDTWEQFTLSTGAPPPPPPTPGKTMDVMTWVPSYGQSAWKAALSANTGGAYNPRNTLTRIGGQFFQVQSNGTLVTGVSDADVQWTVDFAHANGIKFLVCAHNYVNDWDWGVAASAFGANRAALVSNLLALVTRWGADGVDIDFEGNLAGDPNRAEFATFIRDLGTQLHARGKELTVDIFPNVWNQPNTNWLADWVGYSDAVNSMGYDALSGGGGGAAWQTYRWQQDTVLAAGYQCNQLDMGMPGWVGSWGAGGMGTSVLAHVNELLSGSYNRYPTSVAIWDAQFNGAGWLSADVWSGLHTLRTRTCP